jgi:thymidine kinase
MSLELLGACMYANKTQTLLYKLSADDAIGKKVLYINHAIDTRSNQAFSTHNKLFNINNMTNIVMVKYNQLPDLQDVMIYDTIGIDEFSFFENYNNILKYVEEGQKRVIVAGLVGDFKRQQFGHIIDLIPYCDSYTQLYAWCVPCAKETNQNVNALFTYKYQGNQDCQIDVGASDKYIPVCRKHYLALNNV